MVEFEGMVFNIKYLYTIKITDKTIIEIRLIYGNSDRIISYDFQYRTFSEAKEHFQILMDKIRAAEKIIYSYHN
jgi:hypothetical protein